MSLKNIQQQVFAAHATDTETKSRKPILAVHPRPASQHTRVGSLSAVSNMEARETGRQGMDVRNYGTCGVDGKVGWDVVLIRAFATVTRLGVVCGLEKCMRM